MRNALRHPAWVSLFTLAVACGGVIDGDTDGTTEAPLRGWERPPTTSIVVCPANPPQRVEQPSVGDDKSAATIIHDSDVFWANAVRLTDDQEVAWINDKLEAEGWEMGQRASAMVQMYDLLAPVDSCRA